MTKLNSVLLIGLCGLMFTLTPSTAGAVIPPDFIFSIGAQVAQFFSIIMIFLLSAFGAVSQLFNRYVATIRHRGRFLLFLLVIIITISLLAAFSFAKYKQRRAYDDWLQSSKEYSEQYTIPTQVSDSAEVTPEPDANDQLHIGQHGEFADSKFISNIEISDASDKFIKEYYQMIAEGDIDGAYARSKQSVDKSTFASWYAETDNITLQKLVRIDDTKSSLQLTLQENGTYISYGVLMTLQLEDGQPVRIEKSEVKILAQGQINDTGTVNITEEYAFYDEQVNSTSLVTKNSEFADMISSNLENIIVVDARENIENDNGQFPGSTHIRFADLKAGRWIELPKDKPVIVLCWSGIRGKEVAEFLRTKKILASYLEDGANGWVKYGGKWNGSISFGEQYTDVRYQKIFDTSAVKDAASNGTILVDTRQPYKYAQYHIAGSVNIPIMYTPTVGLEAAFSQVPANSTVITVCDDYVNCFDAKITGVELERRGHTFLGRYNKLWEYEQ